MFQTSPTTDKLDAALAKAQGEVLIALAEKINPVYKSAYADITSYWEACRAALSKNQLTFTQWPIHSTDDRLHLVTRLAHSGEWMVAEFSIPVQKKDAHGYGSAITYAKKFTLAAALGLVSDEDLNDDDGNKACDKTNKAPVAPIAPVITKPTLDPKPATVATPATTQVQISPVIEGIVNLAKQLGWSGKEIKEYLLETYHLERLSELSKEQSAQMFQKLQDMNDTSFDPSTFSNFTGGETQ